MRGAFHYLEMSGRYTDELLSVLQKQVFNQPRTVAIDASALSGITMAMARAIVTASSAMRSKGHEVVMINPPDAFGSFLQLLGVTDRIPILLSAAQLPENPADLADAAKKLARDLQQVRRELETNRLWQFTDREYCWLCPFCGELQDSVRIPSRVQVAQTTVDKASRHINNDCKKYDAANPVYQPRATLEAKVREINSGKIAASKGKVESLQAKVQKMEKKSQWADNIEKGVKIAASRQRKLLPTKPPQVEGAEIAYTYRPCDEVSGDFYDFVEMEGGRTAFVIGDVSGHGIEAGILMGMTKKVLSIRLAEMGDAVAAMKQTNADIVKDMDRSSFVTVCAIVYDPATRKLVCARAGHNPAILYNRAWGEKTRTLEKGGLMIGMAAPRIFDAQFVGEEYDVQPGDILLLYTDGIEEGKNAEGEEFGLDRMIKVFKSEAAKPGSYVLGALFYEFDQFTGGVEREDDLTAVCVKFK